MPRLKHIRTLTPLRSTDAYKDGLRCGIANWAYGCNPYDHLPQHYLQKSGSFGDEFDWERSKRVYREETYGISDQIQDALRKRYKRILSDADRRLYLTNPAEDWTRGWLEGSRQVGKVYTWKIKVQ